MDGGAFMFMEGGFTELFVLLDCPFTFMGEVFCLLGTIIDGFI